MELQTVKLDEDGRISLPQSILQELDVMPMDEFLIFMNGDGITLKKILRKPNAVGRFQKLAQEVEAQFSAQGVIMTDIDEAIAWARKKITPDTNVMISEMRCSL